MQIFPVAFFLVNGEYGFLSVGYKRSIEVIDINKPDRIKKTILLPDVKITRSGILKFTGMMPDCKV